MLTKTPCPSPSTAPKQRKQNTRPCNRVPSTHFRCTHMKGLSTSKHVHSNQPWFVNLQTISAHYYSASPTQLPHRSLFVQNRSSDLETHTQRCPTEISTSSIIGFYLAYRLAMFHMPLSRLDAKHISGDTDATPNPPHTHSPQTNTSSICCEVQTKIVPSTLYLHVM